MWLEHRLRAASSPGFLPREAGGGLSQSDAGPLFRPPLRAGARKRIVFPPPLRDGAAKIVLPRTTQASARPGGGEAPALGRDGRWPGALAPGWREATLRRGKGNGLCQWGGGQGERKAPPPAAQGLHMRISVRRPRDHLVTGTQAAGGIVTRISSERGRGRPDAIRCASPARIKPPPCRRRHFPLLMRP